MLFPIFFWVIRTNIVLVSFRFLLWLILTDFVLGALYTDVADLLSLSYDFMIVGGEVALNPVILYSNHSGVSWTWREYHLTEDPNVSVFLLGARARE